jgi:hypothetical protein
MPPWSQGRESAHVVGAGVKQLQRSSSKEIEVGSWSFLIPSGRRHSM